MRTFKACLAPVKNRGIPPVTFLNELVDWAETAPDFIFARNDRADVYGSVVAELGPWEGILHRRAVMLEVLRVLAGFESSWNWKEGRDMSASNTEPWTEETGAFQVSANAVTFDPSLKAFVIHVIGKFDSPYRTHCFAGFDATKFIVQMKADHRFAIEFMARLSRFTTRHNGPLLRKEVNPFLSREAVAEFQSFLSSVD